MEYTFNELPETQKSSYYTISRGIVPITSNKNADANVENLIKY